MNVFTKNLLFVVLALSVLMFSLSGCSDSEDKKPAAAGANKGHNPNPFDHSDDMKLSDSQREKFEKQFAEQCVERELKDSTDIDRDRKRAEIPCECIAKFMTRDLTGEEAEKFLDEHQNAHSLSIKYQNAAYHCLQAVNHPKGPQFSKPGQ